MCGRRPSAPLQAESGESGRGRPGPTRSARRQRPHQCRREDPAWPLVARRTSPDCGPAGGERRPRAQARRRPAQARAHARVCGPCSAAGWPERKVQGRCPLTRQEAPGLERPGLAHPRGSVPGGAAFGPGPSSLQENHSRVSAALVQVQLLTDDPQTRVHTREHG